VFIFIVHLPKSVAMFGLKKFHPAMAPLLHRDAFPLPVLPAKCFASQNAALSEGSHSTKFATPSANSFISSRTYALMRGANSVSGRVDLLSNSRADENTDPPADSQMHLADVHGIFDE